MKEFTIGTDFEMPIILKDGTPLSGIGIIGGSKTKPIDIGRGCSKQEDNVMAEFCIPPVTTFDKFIDYINYCIEKGNKIVEEYGASLQALSSANYAKDQLNNKKAMEFGCEASYCVYTKEPSARPKPKDVGSLRGAGFHIHLGSELLCGEGKVNSVDRIVMLLDKYVGVPSLLLDDDNERRKIYGNAGDFRFKDYGIEYRTLGSGLLTFNGIEKVWEGVQTTIKAFLDGEVISTTDYQDIINTNDKEKAASCVREFEKARLQL